MPSPSRPACPTTESCDHQPPLLGDDFMQRPGGGRHPAVLPLDHRDALVLEPLAGMPKVVWVVHDCEDAEVAGQVPHKRLRPSFATAVRRCASLCGSESANQCGFAPLCVGVRSNLGNRADWI
jgi:hypothetical protein